MRIWALVGVSLLKAQDGTVLLDCSQFCNHQPEGETVRRHSLKQAVNVAAGGDIPVSQAYAALRDAVERQWNIENPADG